MRIIVVGAGIFGASTAYRLASEGAEVLLVDEAHAGRATSAGAGIVNPWSSKHDEPAFTRLHTTAADYYLRLIAELEAAGVAETGYRTVGALVLAADAAGLDEAEARIRPRAEGSRAVGTIRRVSAAEAKAMFPPLRDDRMALHISGAARVEAVTIAAALVEVAKARGAEVRHGHVDLALKEGSVVATLDGEALEADRIVVTAGAWANQIQKAIGAGIPVEPQRGQIVHIGLPGVDTSRWPVLVPQTSHYMLAFGDSRVVAGATRETGSGFDYRLTAGGQAEVLNFALELAPGLANGTHIETRIGFRPFTHSMLPMIGGVPGLPNLMIGNGLGAGGLTMGPFAGHLLAQATLGQTPDLDLADYGVPA